MTTKKKILSFVALVASFGLGMLYQNARADHYASTDYSEVRENSPSRKFTNPLLECNIGPEYLANAKVKPSEAKLNAFIADSIKKGDVASTSVYYRDLNNGPYVNIGGNAQFLPASLMKVPLMMYFYKEAEGNPSILDKKIGADKLPKDIHFEQYFKPEQTIDITKNHTVSELIEAMVRYSDNYAATELNSIVDPKELGYLLNDLHIEIPDIENAYVTVKDYSTFFRVLFNSSYLDQDDSEKALRLLSEGTFDKGLVKYLPNNIVVSHKFGERSPDSNGLRQVHDCGIVYFPLHPYLLCVMTRGTDPDVMAETIAKISRLVYQEVEAQN